MHSPRAQNGAALISSLLLALALMALTVTYTLLSQAGYESSSRELAGIRARMVSEEGLHRSLAELRSGEDWDGDGLGDLTWTGPDGRLTEVAVTDLGGMLYRVHSRGQMPRATLATEALVELVDPPPVTVALRAAITARGDVVTKGNITVDGRDHDGTGNAVTSSGVYGISSLQSISSEGSSTVGGNGIAPTNPPDPATVEPYASWADGVDDDGDGWIDEESWDNVDDDGDGVVDEDTNDYPGSPDALFHVPEGTLRTLAQAHGTYFTSVTALNDYITTHGGNMPGGKVIYADFDSWIGVNFGNQMNQVPSIIVQHNSTGTALMKNIHGAFKGVVLADIVEHLNGDFLLIGALVSFADESIGNAFGNGSAQILYSSEVIGALPFLFDIREVRILSWRRAASWAAGAAP